MENHQQLNSTQPAPPAHPTRLAHPAGRARAEEGTWAAAERKGKEQSAKKREKNVRKGSRESGTEGTGGEAKNQGHKAERGVYVGGGKQDPGTSRTGEDGKA